MKVVFHYDSWVKELSLFGQGGGGEEFCQLVPSCVIEGSPFYEFLREWSWIISEVSHSKPFVRLFWLWSFYFSFTFYIFDPWTIHVRCLSYDF